MQVWTQSTQYLQLIGVLLGQFTFGVLGDWIGRQAGMLFDMSVVIIGIIMLTVSNDTTINVNASNWFIFVADMHLHLLQQACPINNHSCGRVPGPQVELCPVQVHVHVQLLGNASCVHHRQALNSANKL